MELHPSVNNGDYPNTMSHHASSASATEFNLAPSPMNVELEEEEDDSSQFACPWSTPKLKGVKFPGCEGHTATLVDNKLYVFGGTNERFI